MDMIEGKEGEDVGEKEMNGEVRISVVKEIEPRGRDIFRE